VGVGLCLCGVRLVLAQSELGFPESVGPLEYPAQVPSPAPCKQTRWNSPLGALPAGICGRLERGWRTGVGSWGGEGGQVFDEACVCDWS
jgi:hypothetical protein